MKKENVWILVGGAGLGAGAMFMLDPRGGRRRRAIVRDKAVRAWYHTGGAVQRKSRDLFNRASGVAASARSLLSRSGPVSDDVLRARIRSRIGRVVGHPSAIEIYARDGIVTLSGPVLAGEVNDLVKTVQSVTGVHQLINHLEVHERAENVPALHGGRRA